MSTYRLLVSLAFVLVLSAPAVSESVRIGLAIAFSTGLLIMWNEHRSER